MNLIILYLTCNHCVAWKIQNVFEYFRRICMFQEYKVLYVLKGKKLLILLFYWHTDFFRDISKNTDWGDCFIPFALMCKICQLVLLAGLMMLGLGGNEK